MLQATFRISFHASTWSLETLDRDLMASQSKEITLVLMLASEAVGSETVYRFVTHSRRVRTKRCAVVINLRYAVFIQSITQMKRIL